MAETRHEILVGLEVTGEVGYARYREAMTPLLKAMGGYFRYDFAVSRVLQGDNGSINRVFVISFPDEATKDAFFADEAYKRIRAEHFDDAVGSTTIIAAFDG